MVDPLVFLEIQSMNWQVDGIEFFMKSSEVSEVVLPSLFKVLMVGREFILTYEHFDSILIFFRRIN